MQDRRKIQFENKIPLTWLLTSAFTVLGMLGSVLWNVAGQSNKLDQLVSVVDKMDRRNIERDAKLENIIRDSYESKGKVDVMEVRVQNLEKDKK